MSFYTTFRNILFVISRISTPLALVFTYVSFILSWTGFSVPDWLSYTTVTLYQTKFGLWNTCIQSITFFSNGYTCTLWASGLQALPDFVQSTQAFITLGVIFITFTTMVGTIGFCLKMSFLRFLPILASIFSLVSVIFFIIGVSVFGEDYISYVSNVSGTSVTRRWGFWIFVPVIIFMIFAVFLFPFEIIYKNYISNRLYTFMGFNKGTSIPLPPPVNFVPPSPIMEPGYQGTKSSGNLEFVPRGDAEQKASAISFDNRSVESGISSNFRTKIKRKFGKPAPTSTANTSMVSSFNARAHESSNDLGVNFAFDDSDFDSRFNGRYLDSVINHVPYYTEDSANSTQLQNPIPPLRQDQEDRRWIWEKK